MSYADFTLERVKDLYQDYLLLKFISISILIYFIFYELLCYLLRLLFHGYVKDRLLKEQNDLKQTNWFSFLKEVHSFYSILNVVFKDYFFRLGLISKKDLGNIDDKIKITDEEKGEILNDILSDCYKLICITIHFLFTLIFIWQYVRVWLIILGFLILLILFAFPIGAIVLIMNIELLNKVRVNILKSKIF